MKTIYKRKEPRNLLQYRLQYRNEINTPMNERSKAILKQAFEDMNCNGQTLKDEIRKALLEDQGYICCYCMREINEENSRIEHWQCQKSHPTLILSFDNMLIACNGNHGNAPIKITCDVCKAERDITINPKKHGLCERIINYEFRSGNISCSDEQYDDDICITLNLNCYDLQEQRKSTYTGFVKAFTKKHNNNWTKEILNREFANLVSLDRRENAGRPKRLPPFYGVIIAFLQNEIQRRA